MGTVMSCSTSAADSPLASLWICTSVGVNSGSSSTGALGSWTTESASTAAAAPTTRIRNLTLSATIPRITRGPHDQLKRSPPIVLLGDAGAHL